MATWQENANGFGKPDIFMAKRVAEMYTYIFEIEKMNHKDAEQISKWTYTGPYSIYSMDGSEECLNELLDGSYYSVNDKDGNLIGYFCFGKAAQVPAGNRFGAYDSNEYTDIGLGVRPDLCGQGLGLRFLQEGMLFARNEMSAGKLRLTVARFNQRAMTVYERAGFVKGMSFERVSEKGNIEFIIMHL